ncbi:MAG TPA: 1,4-dihydroxy-2-naphthoate polyprenyltransferase [Candidatus Limnocylindria bacterium]|nr:1,4-dihydroxy-2-naphthoate polyprenyltransferase [Candidatus Limnocylindria bacterium]
MNWRVWVWAARPPTLSAAIVPVLVGSAVPASRGHFDGGVFVAALVASLLIQIGTNYANDLFDGLRGADGPERLGPPRAVASGVASPRAMAVATATAFALAALAGLYLIFVGGPPILVIGLAAIAIGIAYTGGPYPLGYRGLGELAVFVFMGLIPVTALDWLHSGMVSAVALWAALPVGAMVTAILTVNDLRDIEQDRAAGKRTLAVRLGPTGTGVWYSILLAVAYLAPPLGWLLGVLPAGALAPLLTLPLAIGVGDVVSHRTGRALNAALRDTARLHLLFGALLAAGMLVSLVGE